MSGKEQKLETIQDEVTILPVNIVKNLILSNIMVSGKIAICTKKNIGLYKL